MDPKGEGILVTPHVAFSVEDVPKGRITDLGDPTGILKKALKGLNHSNGIVELSHPITGMLADWDPFDLIARGAPKSEYRYEAMMMATLAVNEKLTYTTMRAIWRYAFANPELFEGDENKDLLSLIADINAII